MYDFVAVIDRDEFIHVRDEALADVDLPAILRHILDGTPFASVGMFTARCPPTPPCTCHRVHCLPPAQELNCCCHVHPLARGTRFLLGALFVEGAIEGF